MADTTDSTTPWQSLIDYCIGRAEGIPHDDANVRLQNAVRSTVADICAGRLAACWFDAKGERHVGPPRMCLPVYDFYSDTIVDTAGNGTAYRVRVCEHRSEAVKSAAAPVALLAAPEPDCQPALFDEPADKATEALPVDSSPVNGAAQQWPWITKPQQIRRTSSIARCRNDLEKHFEPDEILDLEAPEVEKKLDEKGLGYSRPTIKRALMRKTDRLT
jgi:hypothetical protein